uniref:Coiled-coil domain containing 13 n=2 Tax=Latimeria chalumnae TaxID=7897 RepID=H2ZWL8_LATCH|nr:PREDICTED: coiled-coil domain-containing protein 13 isoform X2 [Latimeria chalumnae]|eukprot:XP_014353545.1 PREDICTED: coiled-coil domain-containing protein 13 isoform X2 [Latimeria chalumnae]
MVVMMMMMAAEVEEEEGASDSLRLQFQTLQEQQQQRLQRLMEKKKEKQEESSQGKPQEKPPPPTFGIEDQLKLLELKEEPANGNSRRLLEAENEQLQDQLREIRDENARLYKLLKEKDFEIKYLKKKREEERLALAGTAGLAGDVAATKIVELSKRNRELTAEMEKERSRVKQLNNRIKEVEKELQTVVSSQPAGSRDGSTKQLTPRTLEGILPPEHPELKAMQEKLSAANIKLADQRNQLQTVRQELRMAHKVLVSEVGDSVNIQQLLNATGSWRGRAQQILTLQAKVRDLENQLASRGPESDSGIEEELLGLTGLRRAPVQDKNLIRIRTMEKERKEALEKLTGEHEALQKEHADLRTRLEGAKARNQVLCQEVKSLKQQLGTLMEKGKHDNELVDALLKQQKHLQEVLGRLSQQGQKSQQAQQSLGLQLNTEAQKQGSLIGQLREMVSEREAKVRELEEEVKQLTLKHHHKKQSANISVSEAPPEPSSSSGQLGGPGTHAVTPPTAGGDQPARKGSARTVTSLGHTLIPSSVTQESAGNSIGRTKSAEVKSLQLQVAEFRALFQAAEVERDKLQELVGLLQQRLDTANEKSMEVEKRLQEERRRAVVLEQQLEKARLDSRQIPDSLKVTNRNKSGPAPDSSRLSLSDRRDHSPQSRSPRLPLETQLQELNTRLAIQLDENEALKAALKSALKAKEEDLKLYHEVMGQVKQVFLQALRQYKQSLTQNSSS